MVDLNNASMQHLRSIVDEMKFPDVSNIEYIACQLYVNGPQEYGFLHRALIRWRYFCYSRSLRGQLTRYFNSVNAWNRASAGYRGDSPTSKGYWWRPYKGAPYELTVDGKKLAEKVLANEYASHVDTNLPARWNEI